MVLRVERDAWSDRWKPGMLRPGIVDMRGSMDVRLRPCMNIEYPTPIPPRPASRVPVPSHLRLTPVPSCPRLTPIPHLSRSVCCVAEQCVVLAFVFVADKAGRARGPGRGDEGWQAVTCGSSSWEGGLCIFLCN